MRAIERLRRHRDHDVGAELLRLGEGPAGQRLARDSRGEAEIIFDSGAGAGLSAERARVQDDHRETFRRRVHGGGKPRRTAAHDRDIVDLVAGWADHAKRPGEVSFARIAKHRAVGGDHQRPIRRRRRVALDQFGSVMIPFRIEQMVRKAVAG